MKRSLKISLSSSIDDLANLRHMRSVTASVSAYPAPARSLLHPTAHSVQPHIIVIFAEFGVWRVYR